MEHSILRDSLQGGIPPPMVPIVFAGMAGANIPMETTMRLGPSLHQRASTSGINRKQPIWLLHSSPERLPSSNPYIIRILRKLRVPTQPALAPRLKAQQPTTISPAVPTTIISTRGHDLILGPSAPVASAPRIGAKGGFLGSTRMKCPATQTQFKLRRLLRWLGPGSLCILIQQSPGHTQQQQQPPTSQPQATSAQAQEQSTQSSPNNIFFYHWQPPNSQASGSSNQPTTPSGNFHQVLIG